MFYDSINDFGLKQCLKEKIGKFMERKERNAEGKTSALPNTKLYFSYVLQNFHKKVYISNVIIFKNELKNDFFKSKVKNIPKGVRSTKCPVST